MAGWRTRGYVVDSDDEDESQNSIQPPIPFGENISNDDTSGVILLDQSERVQSSRRKSLEPQHKEIRLHSEDQKGISGTSGSPGSLKRDDLQRGQHRGSQKSGNDSRVSDGGLHVQDDGDIDELQEDHYQNTPAAQLEAELLSGAHELANAALPNQLSIPKTPPSLSPISSMLSSLSGSPHDPILSDGNQSHPSTHQPSKPSGGGRVGIDSSLTQFSNAVKYAQSNKATRNLRQRNPIQLHPYAIESEKYRQILKDRGVKPLRIAQMEAEAANVRRAESQNIEYQGEESQNAGVSGEPPESRSPSPLEAQHTIVSELASTPSDVLGVGDDDLPDVNALLNNPIRKYIGNGHKRRKVAATSFRMPPGMIQEVNKPFSRNNPSVADHGDEDTVYDVPPSPPQSGNQTPVKATRTTLPASKYLQRTEKAPLPTPFTSSEPRRAHVLEVLEDEPSDDHSGNDSESATSNDESSSDEASRTKSASSQLQRVQRKIRGVLPASWLKIDLKAQKKKIGTTHKTWHSPSPEKMGTQRGVARPVTAGGSKSPDFSRFNISAFPLSNSEGSVSKDTGRRQQSPPRRRASSRDDEGIASIGERWGEASEDDRVDAMLTSIPRPRHDTHRDQKRQTKIADGRPKLHSSSLDRRRPSQVHQLKATNQTSKGNRKKPIFRPPSLSILDAPSSHSSSKSSMPPFLKIASRIVRSRKNQGKHSPSRKYLRLATREDDTDANETLRNWREGTLAPVANKIISPKPYRQPLYPRSANDAVSSRTPSIRESPNDSRGLSQLKPTINHRVPSVGDNKIQTSLDRLVQRRSKMGIEPSEVEGSPGTVEQPKKRGQLVASIRENYDSRPAMLETAGEAADQLNAQATFRRDLSRINHFDDESGLHNVLRLLEKDSRQSPGAVTRRTVGQMAAIHPKQNIGARRPAVRKNRKRRPLQMDVSALWSRRSTTPIIIDDVPDTTPCVAIPHPPRGEVVTGLGPFGTRYTDNFGITPLPTGTCFHETTFIGSGAFSRSQRLDSSSALDSSRGYALLHINNKTYRWGPWNDKVSSELGEIMVWIGQESQAWSTESNQQFPGSPHSPAFSALKAIVAYFSDHISFLDPVDRLSCVQKCKTITSTLFVELEERRLTGIALVPSVRNNPRLAFVLQLGTIALVFADQVHRVSQHELVSQQSRDEVHSRVQNIAQVTASLAMTKCTEEFETCISECRNSDAGGYIIRNEQIAIEAFVVTQHVLALDHKRSADFWKVVQIESPAKTSDGAFDIRLPEDSWKKVFILLPFLEFDLDGILETGRRFKVPFDNWPFIRHLVSPVLESSLKNPRGQSPTFNAYCRALFCRCLHLIKAWGWRRCESIIGTLFDYFARNQLAHLKNEESQGSPVFLEHLAGNPSLAAEPRDRCFHILLKIIGTGVRHMGRSYPEKKIRDIIWRLMPNHGRSHPKEEAIHQADLDALRNHHDLLCTLYWASPPSCRPRLSVIRNLVHLESSHREACHINIRAWFNLVRFQLSTDEPIKCLDDFAVWHDDLLVQILRQHSLARTEAEDQVRSVQHAEGLAISSDLLESTIAKNQRQVEAILGDALVSLKLAIDQAQSCEAATAIVSTSLSKVFGLFDTGRNQGTKTIIQALDVLSALASKSERQQLPTRQDNDDSQDYGDWPTFENDDDALALTGKVSYESPLQKFQEPLRNLLSNSFGSDTIPDDALLMRIIDVWVCIAQALVRSGMRSWNDYVDRFGNDSWSSLRDTEQTRKYIPLYLATLIEKDLSICTDHSSYLLTSWVHSLVERESLLKYQHRFTESLLNAKCDSPILKNLPFWTNTATSRFEISAADFTGRRISLLSSVLSNMRVSLETAVFDPLINAAQLRQEYKDLLRSLMGTMKRNYQELGHGSNLRGAYVTFVHKVVELLQQHTSTICPVDRFFTDNGAFPLPSTDPTYVVGQLKNYTLRLQESRTPKQLAVFLQSVSERAAVDGQQPYLVSQLHAAMSSAFENSTPERPTLRSFLVKAIIPAYIEMACTTSLSCYGWILALPYLQALQIIFNELLLDLDGTNPQSVSAVISIITAFLGSVRQSFGSLLLSSNFLEDAGTLKLLSACYLAITTSLPTLDYVVRLSGPTQRAVENMEFISSFASHIIARLQEHDDPPIIEKEPTIDAAYSDTRSFATLELKESLTKNWSYDSHEQQYYFTRGASKREVLIDIGLYEEEKATLLKVFADFFASVGAMPALCDDDDDNSTMRRRRIDDSDQFMF